MKVEELLCFFIEGKAVKLGLYDLRGQVFCFMETVLVVIAADVGGGATELYRNRNRIRI